MIGFLAATVALAQLPSLTGDFDHDGRRDAAALVHNGSGYQLVVRRGAAGTKPLVLLSMANPDRFYLGKAQSGVFSTACGKGLAGAIRCDHPRIALQGNELAFGVREASNAVAVWKGDRFDLVWLTD